MGKPILEMVSQSPASPRRLPRANATVPPGARTLPRQIRWGLGSTGVDMTNTQDDDTQGAPSSSDPNEATTASERAPAMEIDRALMRAWSLAATHPALWRDV